jgi:exodeoxyribonuclease V alpha subunit
MRGHPIFVAQHATGACCRGCLEKWHRIPKGRSLTEPEIEYLLGVLAHWLTRQVQSHESHRAEKT